MTLYVLDTDHLSLYMRGLPSLRTRFHSISADQIAIAVISAEELLRGRLAQIHRATTGTKRVLAYHELIETIDFLRNLQILPFDNTAELQFSRFSSLRTRVGSQDLRIAAITLTQNATLVTRNLRDFGQIPGMRLEDWSS